MPASARGQGLEKWEQPQRTCAITESADVGRLGCVRPSAWDALAMSRGLCYRALWPPRARLGTPRR